MGRWLPCALALLCCWPSGARAEGRALGALPDVHGACRGVRDRTHPELFVLDVDPGWRFGRRRGERLFVNTRRNPSALDGQVSLLLTSLEPIAFEADEERARALREAAGAGARLRIGFFLGFDEPRRQPCVLRGPHAVTIVRADLAFAELLASDGGRLARTETERLRAWRDDREELAIPGEGPRGVVGQARFSDGQLAPPGWQRALQQPDGRASIARCHAAGVARGAAEEAQVIVRLNVETRTGRVRRADVALSSLGDSEEAECVAHAVAASAGLPPGPAEWRADVVDMTVPVRLVAD